MATQNTIVVRSGTGFTVDVTALNLLADLNIKDFVVLVNSTFNNQLNWLKNSPFTLTYNGTALPANSTVEIRRATPTSVVAPAQFGTRIRSTDWNAELDRISRRAEEYALNGIGPGSVVTSTAPLNEAFGVSWSTDVLYPPTRQAVYNYTVTLAPLVSPSFTGTPTAPTATAGTATSQIATTAFVGNALSSYASLSSPSFSGTPSLPTGTVAVTQLVGTANTSVATTAFVGASNRPAVEANRITTTQTLAHNATTTLIFNNKLLDTNTIYNNATGEVTITVPGRYLVCAGIFVDNICNVLSLGVFLNGTEVFRLSDQRNLADQFFLASGSYIVNCAVNDILTIRLFQTNTGAAARALQTTLNLSKFSLVRLNV